MAVVRSPILSGLLVALSVVTGVQGDGTGLIGWGKTLYNPTCSFACRNVVRKQQLGCTPVDSTANHGTAHNPVSTPPGCFVKDEIFLKTMALCIDTYCPLTEKPSLGLIEDYWASHLGTGTLGDYKYVPVMSYQAALAAARAEERQAAAMKQSNSTMPASNATTTGQSDSHSGMNRGAATSSAATAAATEKSTMFVFDVKSLLPTTKGGSTALNVTSFVAPKDFQMQWNYMYDFETNENGHSTNTIAITLVAILLPVLISLIKFIPGLSNSAGWTYIKSLLIYPAVWGKRHHVPIFGGVVPTRGQALYIGLISFLNITLLLTPYTIHQPQASFSSLNMQTISIVGNRAGVLAMGNVVALFLFAARNNPLLFFTEWSYGTYLLMHRWLGYWAIFHTALHSVMLLAYYSISGSYAAELKRDYWVWGIVGTVAACALVPSSLLIVRQRLYEFFLASHVVLSLLFLVGFYYHIWYVYTYNWGYEIWMFVAGAIWGLDRLIRLGRMAFQGSRTAVVTTIQDVDGEYLRIEVEGKSLQGGVAYLCFPTLGWRFWETHPFSVACSGSGAADDLTPPSTGKTSSQPEPPAEKTPASQVVTTPTSPSTNSSNPALARTVFFTRTRDGLTKQLAARAASSPARLRVLIDGPYHHSGPVASQLRTCTSIVCIAGGVGITAMLPYLRNFSTTRKNASVRLCWGVRKAGLLAALEGPLGELSSGVVVETSVGARSDLAAILAREMVGEGVLGIIVCGPPGLSDDVRARAVGLARERVVGRPYVLVDEAFGW